MEFEALTALALLGVAGVSRLIGREIHFHCPDGLSNSKLPGLLTERRLGVTATTRNWRTVSRLVELSGDSG